MKSTRLLFDHQKKYSKECRRLKCTNNNNLATNIAFMDLVKYFSQFSFHNKKVYEYNILYKNDNENMDNSEYFLSSNDKI